MHFHRLCLVWVMASGLSLIPAVFGLSQELSSLHEESRHCFQVLSDRSMMGDSNFLISLPYQNYSHSMETFINLVERIEDKSEERGRRLPADLLIKILLRKFNVEGLKVERREKFEQRVKGKLRNNLIDTLLDSSGSSSSLRIDLTGEILDPEQHCTLFYMLSRFVLPLGNVQIPNRRGRGSQMLNVLGNRDSGNNRGGGSNTLSRVINNYGINPNDIPTLPHDSSNRNPFTFYEQGVVRLRASETDAIQLSRVLIGALAGLTNTPQVTMFELYERLLKSEMNGNSRSGSSISTASMNELRNEKRRIDPIAMLTLGDLWAIWQPTASSTGFMGSSGSTSTRAASSWNNPFCPFYFQLQSPFQLPQAGITGGASIGPGMVQFAGVSASELRGGLDGLAIGTALSTVRQARSTMKLSQILKMYYYGQGISSPAGDVSVCQRQDQLEFFLPNLINSAAHYLQFIDLTSSKVFTSEAYARAQLKETEHDFQSKLSDAVSLSDSNAALLNAWCAQKRSQMISSGFDIRNYGSSAGKRFDLRSRGSMDESVYNGNSFNGFGDPYAESNLPGHGKPANGNRYQPSNWDVNRAECDTPVDLLFVVDASNQVAQQLSIVNRILAVHPTMHKESISVLANRPGSGQYRNGLDVISWRERIKEKVVCDLQTALEDKSQYTINRAEELINRLDFTLSEFKREQNESLIVPAKTIILFNFGFVKRDQSQDFYAAKRVLENHHRLVKFLVIGQGEREDLGSLVMNARDPDEHVIPDSSELTAMALEVANGACISPVSIQYNHCNVSASRYQDVQRNLFVRPNKIEYVAISPEYFHSSEDIWIRFAVQNERQIRICASRTNVRPQNEPNDDRDCRDSTSQHDRHIEFRYNRPCYDRSKESCASIYFAVIGLPGGMPDCFESECSSFDQIKVEVSHFGMLCNSAMGTLSRWMAATLLQFFALRYFVQQSMTH